MILVDVFVTSLGKNYDIKIDENSMIGNVIKDVVDMIGVKEGCKLEGDTECLCLCNKETKKIMLRDRTLQECNVSNGTVVALV